VNPAVAEAAVAGLLAIALLQAQPPTDALVEASDRYRYLFKVEKLK
jgi:hypothetical protein